MTLQNRGPETIVYKQKVWGKNKEVAHLVAPSNFVVIGQRR